MARRGQEKPEVELVETADRVVAAARGCFERFGIRKTTIGDIATAAGVSRPTVYKNFASKEAILDAIAIVEIGKVHETLRGRLRRQPHFADRLTDALLVSVQVAMENTYVRWFIQDPELRSRTLSPDSPLMAATRDRWRSLYESASASGDLADDIDFDDMVFWLSLSQESLVMHQSSAPIDERRLKRIIRRFVVEPLLSPRARTAAARRRRADVR